MPMEYVNEGVLQTLASPSYQMLARPARVHQARSSSIPHCMCSVHVLYVQSQSLLNYTNKEQFSGNIFMRLWNNKGFQCGTPMI